jgi:U3 small nucleolar RNA-associated protein 14
VNETPKQSKQTSASLAGTFEPSTSLEKTIDSLLRESGLRSEKEIASFEDLALKKVSIDEVRHRQAQLRAMRELMFRQDLKAKRIAKIKSKTYRRIHKKEREREMAKQAAEEDSDGEEAMERKMKVETARAKERMTLRHKNTGDWATKMLNRGQHDLETRRAISEQIRRGDELRRKVLGNEEEDEDDDDEVSDSEEDLEELKLIKDPSKWGGNQFTMGQEEIRRGVMGMKFMRDAEERQKQINAKHLAEIKASLNDGSDAEDLEATANGRKTFVPGDQVFSQRLSSDSKVILGNPREEDANRDGKGIDDEVTWKIVKNPFHMDKA